MKEMSQCLTKACSTPIIRCIDPKDITTLKTLIAAGWVIVASTSLTDEMLGPGFRRYGFAVAPVPGQKRKEEGHAWLLVGYDHVDGSTAWKYQGHFLALNSWGKGFPSQPVDSPGLCRIPFAAFLTEGVEAYALRFP